MSNMMLNLKNPREDSPLVLGYQLDIIGNMSINFKKFNQSEFFLEHGVQNIMIILDQNNPWMNDICFIKMAFNSIRKITAGMHMPLLD